MTARRSARFVSWVRAWRAGLVPYDDVADEIAAGEEHLAADVPGTWTDVPLTGALAVLSKLHPDDVRLVLPAPGDPRGLPGPGPFSGAALAAGEGVVAGEHGLVPEVRTHTSGSGDTWETVLWRVFPLPAARRPPEFVSAAEAEAELSTALMSATTTLTKLDVAQWRPELAGALAAIRKPDNTAELPPGYDPRSRRLYARASVLDRVLALAELSAPGGAVNGYEAQQRDAALRPLTAACRRALVAACNAPMI
ncbi:hypothetical protein Val02_43920 [Virgisporangium aliadipatigenens]|uniref:Uncharacterized protein n=2 Tax=Virgisporangium aliadipatigenens TaxID=741659 RepID=A0A8J3YLQ5_9ACTN|nr:hypothetical protein Val02_43920 [Virgisporangium aliadipatigenens]